jgi:hypothetical protein
MAWRNGNTGVLEPGQRLSPWFEAHGALLRGDEGGAMGVILADLRSGKPGRWTPPTAATAEQLASIVEILPAELPPAGNEHSARVLTEIMLATGSPQRAGEYAAAQFATFRSSMLAAVVARSAAQMGDRENALRWLGAASEAATSESATHRRFLAQIMDGAPELAGLRGDPTFTALRGELV